MTTATATNQKLLEYIERVERLDNEKRGISEDIRGVLKDAHDEGFDKKIIRQIVKLRRKSIAERTEERQLIETYMASIGETI